MSVKNGGSCARVYTTHGKKKNQGKLAIVNGQMALCYTEGKDEEVVAYTPISELMQKSCGIVLQSYQLNF